MSSWWSDGRLSFYSSHGCCCSPAFTPGHYKSQGQQGCAATTAVWGGRAGSGMAACPLWGPCPQGKSLSLSLAGTALDYVAPISSGSLLTIPVFPCFRQTPVSAPPSGHPIQAKPWPGFSPPDKIHPAPYRVPPCYTMQEQGVRHRPDAFGLSCLEDSAEHHGRSLGWKNRPWPGKSCPNPPPQ